LCDDELQVRVGVVEGLASLANILLDKWQKNSSSVAFQESSRKRFTEVEDLMWRCLLSNHDENDAADLAAAAEAEFALPIPASLALFNTAEYHKCPPAERAKMVLPKEW
jgi:hypothetical protein